VLSASTTEQCPGCGVVLPLGSVTPHRYMTASAACWAGYGELLAAQFAQPSRMDFHQLVVDSYAVQHPGGVLAQQVQSVGIHLMTLALFIEDGTNPALGTRLHREMVSRPVFHYLPPPSSRGELTYADVPSGGPVNEARSAAYAWAGSTWSAWGEHHSTVDAWLRESGLRR
jgi:Family of unknown function (DUF5946)